MTEKLIEAVRYVQCVQKDCEHNSNGGCAYFTKMPTCATITCVESLQDIGATIAGPAQNDCDSCAVASRCQYVTRDGNRNRINCPLWRPKG